ncbi:DUF4160 domain-containing protein [Ammoniphilus resinae]|uniref:DUF4160 domain-containing protein n=1 Tax=Ammoniphilus resinae TaxID=861532 RepID=A0ABS4GSK9_9BACL|nr:DUF4160 domain-containing protein [Ammoniphilus resinae]MBP1933236.1 hypothetical protein [Ammoniphilus resinae]
MPRIGRFGGMSIAMYYNDHIPPHFHVIYGELFTRIAIDSGEYLKGDVALPRTRKGIFSNG